VDPREKEQLAEALLPYCELDTLDMVEIYRKLVDLITQPIRFLEKKEHENIDSTWKYRKWKLVQSAEYGAES
jgi:hypothetical protein